MRLELFTFDIFLPLFGAREPAVCACGWVRMRSCTCVCMRQSSCAQPLRSSVRGGFVLLATRNLRGLIYAHLRLCACMRFIYLYPGKWLEKSMMT